MRGLPVCLCVCSCFIAGVKCVGRVAAELETSEHWHLQTYTNTLTHTHTHKHIPLPAKPSVGVAGVEGGCSVAGLSVCLCQCVGGSGLSCKSRWESDGSDGSAREMNEKTGLVRDSLLLGVT